MAVELNHTIVAAHDKWASARSGPAADGAGVGVRLTVLNPVQVHVDSW
ncbi:MAG: hypothetical protein JF597_29080 [Streptomyces sp.]|nr:hypothetical protein [Streptomyces sp.]MBW8797489.1 hypothetical protein [Streptomyces sp.]